MVRFAILAAVVALGLVGCGAKDATTTPATGKGPQPNGGEGPRAGGPSLAEARKGFVTKLKRRERADEPVDEPPANTFRKVQYDAPVGKCAAYLTPDPKDGKKRPAIVWITGGDCNTIGDVWSRKPASNDQTARQYRDAGLVMMFPSLRGGNDNPGVQENFYGEVDDVIAAADYLAKLDYVDPKRVYLGGHSTGGTLVMLVAAVPNPFRAAFSFGPADDIANYGGQFTEAVNLSDAREVELRSPANWVHSISCPTFVFEGTVNGNLGALQSMESASTNPKAKFVPVEGANHFSILAPVNGVIARKLIADTGPEPNIAFTAAELNRLFGR
ncbi:MAG: peptidase [Planctomycetes bacterium]|nr:peptidase [Planctomycetota bacterium]